ncbi:hypothetical protein [Pseudomonas gingeri]|uniref:hypothetical protein n=1 Tax=Pseudomonas gingeri TaxID=117681 RepID=UPI0015A35938|nr:hypothetical protein [Pseudomonas gingeri]NWE49449.1 hypothetical protein [Pseudomonas gingeri]NWE69925.1 hypothetical protein [Pseudomonas gingeri]
MIYTNGEYLQEYPIPTGDEWREATEQDIELITRPLREALIRQTELDWQSSELAIIGNQLLAIEEEANDALPGTRQQWLAYRTLVRLWHESPGFPDVTTRPSRPAQ